LHADSLSSYDYQINPDNGFTNWCEEEPLAESHESKDSELHLRRQKHPPSHKPLLQVPRYSRRAHCPWNPDHLSQVPNAANRRKRAGSQICPSCFLLPLPTCPLSHWTHRPPQNDLPLCGPWRFSYSYFGQDGQLKCLSTCISLAPSFRLTASILLHYVELFKGDDCDGSFSS
jgi:hypothetical protein